MDKECLSGEGRLRRTVKLCGNGILSRGNTSVVTKEQSESQWLEHSEEGHGERGGSTRPASFTAPAVHLPEPNAPDSLAAVALAAGLEFSKIEQPPALQRHLKHVSDTIDVYCQAGRNLRNRCTQLVLLLLGGNLGPRG